MLRVADFFADSDTGRARRANEDAFRARFPVAFQTVNYRVYDVRSGHDQG